jgi:4-hydroxy-tetrahydrodipicolinate synthase
MKDSSGDWNNTKTFLDAFAVRAGRAVFPDAPRSSDPATDTQTTFDVFVGSESFLLAGLRNGGAGTISATANVNPVAIYKLYTEWVRSRTGGNSAVRADLDEQQARLNVVRDVFGKKYPMISALKQGIAICANDPAWAKVRPPLVELTAEQVKILAAELKAISFTMPGILKY